MTPGRIRLLVAPVGFGRALHWAPIPLRSLATTGRASSPSVRAVEVQDVPWTAPVPFPIERGARHIILGPISLQWAAEDTFDRRTWPRRNTVGTETDAPWRRQHSVRCLGGANRQSMRVEPDERARCDRGDTG
jgi:hypothetical protein